MQSVIHPIPRPPPVYYCPGSIHRVWPGDAISFYRKTRKKRTLTCSRVCPVPTSNVATASARTQPPPSCPGPACSWWQTLVVSALVACCSGPVVAEPGILYSLWNEKYIEFCCRRAYTRMSCSKGVPLRKWGDGERSNEQLR